MKKKQYLPMMVLTLALLLMVSVPVVFVQLETTRGINEITLFPVDAPPIQRPAEEHDLWEKIWIFRDASVVWGRKHSGDRADPQTGETEAVLLRQMEEQVGEIHRNGGLPALRFTDAEHASVKKETYLRVTEEPYADVLTVWRIEAAYPEFTVSTYMDSQTFVLYDVSILSKKEEILYPSDISEDGFWAYLNTFSAFDATGDERLRAHGTYGKREIHLCLWSEDADRPYCFHGPGAIRP